MAENKKTIFMTIGRGMTSRDLLLNAFFEKLKEKYNVVIFGPLAHDADFAQRFQKDGIKMELLNSRKLGRLEKFFITIHKALIYNPTIEIRSRYGLLLKEKESPAKSAKFYFQKIVFGFFLSKIKFLKDWLKWLDAKIFTSNDYAQFFVKYRPIAVFATNICSDDEIYFLREAKRAKIFCFGMAKSWDNFSKFGVREKVDRLIVWSDYMRQEAEAFQNYKASDIEIVGIPQFDIYWRVKNECQREEFINLYGLDKNKKTILFGQEVPALTVDDPYIVKILKDWIEKENKNYQILIRPNFAYKNAADSFNDLVDNKVVFLDSFNNPSNFKDRWDLSAEHHKRLALSMRFSDLVITSASTLALDALGSDNHAICYCFDQDKKKPMAESIKPLYQTLWFRELIKAGLENNMAYSEMELLQKTEKILECSQKELPEYYKNIIEKFCYRIDGQSGQRLFGVLDKTLSEK